jgi:Fe-S-cluster containining protein
MPVEVKFHDLVRLGICSPDDEFASRRKLVNRLKREGIIQSYREVSGNFMLTQKANDDCYFMDSQTRLCTVYDKRPDVCRNFPSTMGIRPGFCPALKK